MPESEHPPFSTSLHNYCTLLCYVISYMKSGIYIAPMPYWRIHKIHLFFVMNKTLYICVLQFFSHYFYLIFAYVNKEFELDNIRFLLVIPNTYGLELISLHPVTTATQNAPKYHRYVDYVSIAMPVFMTTHLVSFSCTASHNTAARHD